MALFPLFVELDGLDILIVGGGQVAKRKALSLAEYGALVRLVAPKFCLRGWRRTGVSGSPGAAFWSLTWRARRLSYPPPETGSSTAAFRCCAASAACL